MCIRDSFNALTAAVQDIDWEGIGETIGTAVREAVQAAFTAISAFIEGEGGVGLAIVNSIRAGMAGLGLLLLSILRGAVRLLLGFISGVFAVDLEAGFAAAWNAVLDWLKAFSLQDAMEGVIRTIGDAWESMKGWLGEKIRAAFGVAGDLLFGGTDEPEAQPEDRGLLGKIWDYATGNGDESPLQAGPAGEGVNGTNLDARTQHYNVEVTNHIDSQGTDPVQLAQNINVEARRQLHVLVEASDSRERR